MAWILRSRLLGAFIILCLLYTFSRTERPRPKAFSGREVYDPEVHWNVCDFDVAITALVRVLAARARPRSTKPSCRRLIAPQRPLPTHCLAVPAFQPQRTRFAAGNCNH